MNILVVLSGGQDSTTCLFWARGLLTDKGDALHAVTFDYGQRHRIEIEAARKIAGMANVDSHEVIEVPNYLQSASPLTSENELERYESYAQMDRVIGSRVELTFVPMRNTLFLTIAANRAVALGCNHIVTGISEQDNANYPDCRQLFLSQMEEAINQSLGRHMEERIKILAPLLNLSKAQSIALAMELAGCIEALAYSHTSYDGKYPPTDMNHSNVLRAQGFLEAGVPDPLVVRAWREGRMELPTTANYASLRGDA
ncbi:7-cyano-7-deazaguanine synthase QueC [Microvirga lotononidis]|uniref:7-cyano-7-deazaguanine synthase n=1 Tax=Microvirga lotononidis TaxID=864069 RepID=I4YK77_9HYPH|nr:7-cyano-7-deazaguanine synthase QueC [Microvirga lotononidis]EIM24369.1 queuosine biosynthesis protein QueC [Microvirga lotononidis]WQO30331.1 7-cyano-7-deazaguanine synthase QueC [Microvirga lotononidis]